MALQWKLFSFATGVILRPEPLPVIRGGSVSIDVLGGDTMEIGVNLKALTPAERTSWRTTFSPMERGLALVDDSYEWDEPEAIVFAGPINKVRVPIGTNTAHVQIVGGLNDYMQARIVADVWGDVLTDGTASRVFSGATWSAVMSNIVAACFSVNGVPSDAPKPPQVLGTLPSGDGDTHSKSVRITDAKTYHEVLEEVKNTDSGTGLEWRWEARYADATAGRIVWDFKTGNPSAPHIGAATSYSLILSPTSAAKLSAFSTIITAGDMYTKIYIQSKPGDDEAKDGADFKGLAVTQTAFPVLLERFYNPGVELTTAQLDEQLSKRIAYAARTSSEIAFTVEEVGDPNTWLRRLGGMLYVTPSENTEEGQGHEALVRIVGVSFTPGKGTVSLDVMEPQPNYGKLPMPRKAIADIARDPRAGDFGYGGNSPSLNAGGFGGGGGGGGEVPWNPGDPEEGDPGQSFDWGSGGAPSDGTPPPPPGDYTITRSSSEMDGRLRMASTAQNEGNIIFQTNVRLPEALGGGESDLSSSGAASFTRESDAAPWTISEDLYAQDELSLKSGYLHNGHIVNVAEVLRKRFTVADVAAFANHKAIATPGKYVRTMNIEPGAALTVAGFVIVPIWVTGSKSLPGGTSASEAYEKTLFLRARYTSYENVGPLQLDPETSMNVNYWRLGSGRGESQRPGTIRAGSWVMFKKGQSAVAANYFAGGVSDNENDWAYWPAEIDLGDRWAVARDPEDPLRMSLFFCVQNSSNVWELKSLHLNGRSLRYSEAAEVKEYSVPGGLTISAPFTIHGRVMVMGDGDTSYRGIIYSVEADGSLKVQWPQNSIHRDTGERMWHKSYGDYVYSIDNYASTRAYSFHFQRETVS